MKRILVQLVLVQKSYGCFNIRLWEPKPSLLRVRIHFGRLEDRQNSRGSFFFCSYYFFFELIFFPKSSLQHYFDDVGKCVTSVKSQMSVVQNHAGSNSHEHETQFVGIAFLSEAEAKCAVLFSLCCVCAEFDIIVLV